jgi:DNA-directed RNA polymerase subunit RPC12/RpoP
VSASANTLYECTACHSELRLENSDDIRKTRCPTCGNDLFVQIAVVALCDFCSTPADRFWTYGCEDFTYGVPEAPRDGSVGDWAACDDCHALIEAGDHRGLIRRNVDLDIERHPERAAMRHGIWAVIARIHKGFHEHRTGEPPFRETKKEYEKRKRKEGV